MARTRASVGAKVASGKSSKARCSVAPPATTTGSSGSSDKASRSYSGGNSVCPRETPKWQKPITNFFISKDVHVDGNQSDDDGATAGSSKSKPKRNVIQSDDETENEETDRKLTENGEDKLKSTENGEDELKSNENGEDKLETEENELKTKETENNNIEKNEEVERPTNHALDETLELEPLSGEDCRKIEDYYSKNSKGKGKGKKTKGKENLDGNVEWRSSLKRDLEDVSGEDGQPSKRVKVD